MLTKNQIVLIENDLIKQGAVILSKLPEFSAGVGMPELITVKAMVRFKDGRLCQLSYVDLCVTEQQINDCFSLYGDK